MTLTIEQRRERARKALLREARQIAARHRRRVWAIQFELAALKLMEVWLAAKRAWLQA